MGIGGGLGAAGACGAVAVSGEGVDFEEVGVDLAAEAHRAGGEWLCASEIFVPITVKSWLISLPNSKPVNAMTKAITTVMNPYSAFCFMELKSFPAVRQATMLGEYTFCMGLEIYP